MTLAKLLDFRHTVADGEVKHATRGLLKQINKYWGINVVEADLKVVLTETSYRSQGGEILREFCFHFDPTQSLIDKLKDYPEALI